MFKAEPVDQYGNLIDRHNLWEMVGVRYRRALFPGFSDKAEFMFSCPATLVTGDPEDRERAAYASRAGNVGNAGGARRTEPTETPLDEEFALRVPEHRVTMLRVTARLLYRKADQFFLNFLFGEEAGLTAPITMLSSDQKDITVLIE